MKKIQTGDTVKVHYTGKLEDGSIFDTSLAEGREPIEVTLGQGQLIPGFEAGLIDMSEGEKKTVEIESADAYGDPRPEMINEVPKANVPEGVQSGEMLQGMGPQGPVNVKVVSVTEETVTLDANHPLAGNILIFDLEIVSIS
jgi:FKBP-type peptidyl-prolyl cis-trans isomerase SlpA